jgi:chromosome segregation ATPase
LGALIITSVVYAKPSKCVAQPLLPTPQDEVDNVLLYAVQRECVAFLVTEDRGMHKKAVRCGVADRVYGLEEALDKHERNPKAAFVTPEGVLIGPALIRTTPEADSRADEIRRELAIVEHDLAKTKAALRPKHERLADIVRELAVLGGRVEEADAEITKAAERMARLEADVSGLAKDEEVLSQRLVGLDEAGYTRFMVHATAVRIVQEAMSKEIADLVDVFEKVQTLRHR